MSRYVAIVDYDAGNIRSVQKAVEFIGEKAVITREKNEILKADHVILPGVGAFGDCMDKLNKYGLVDVLKEVAAGDVPFLGICLGLQLLYEDSEETPGVKGLGILKGHVLRIPGGEGIKVPHMGWNALELNGGRLFNGLPENPYVYFVHSYYLKADDRDEVKAKTFYSVSIDASVEKGNVFACQFHPEKSAELGLQILRNFTNV